MGQIILFHPTCSSTDFWHPSLREVMFVSSTWILRKIVTTMKNNIWLWGEVIKSCTMFILALFGIIWLWPHDHAGRSLGATRDPDSQEWPKEYGFPPASSHQLGPTPQPSWRTHLGGGPSCFQEATPANVKWRRDGSSLLSLPPPKSHAKSTVIVLSQMSMLKRLLLCSK